LGQLHCAEDIVLLMNGTADYLFAQPHPLDLNLPQISISKDSLGQRAIDK
jgi:hypothetical protein